MPAGGSSLPGPHPLLRLKTAASYSEKSTLIFSSKTVYLSILGAPILKARLGTSPFLSMAIFSLRGQRRRLIHPPQCPIPARDSEKALVQFVERSHFLPTIPIPTPVPGPRSFLLL